MKALAPALLLAAALLAPPLAHADSSRSRGHGRRPPAHGYYRQHRPSYGHYGYSYRSPRPYYRPYRYHSVPYYGYGYAPYYGYGGYGYGYGGYAYGYYPPPPPPRYCPPRPRAGIGFWFGF
jgi:hypothetical protein